MSASAVHRPAVASAEAEAVAAPGSLRNVAVSRIRDWISTGTLPAGTSFAEAALSERLGLSRAPVREALVLLSHLGWVTSHPRSGYLVVSPTLNELRELGEMRLLLEPRAAALAARAIDPAGDDAAALVAFGGTAHDSDSPVHVGDDLTVEHYRYRRRIAVASGNRELDRALAETLLKLGRYLRLGPVQQAEPIRPADDRVLTETILAGDEESAARIAAQRVRAEQDAIMAAIVNSDAVGSMPLRW